MGYSFRLRDKQIMVLKEWRKKLTGEATLGAFVWVPGKQVPCLESVFEEVWGAPCGVSFWAPDKQVLVSQRVPGGNRAHIQA